MRLGRDGRAPAEQLQEAITREVASAIALQIRDVSAVLSELIGALAAKGALDRGEIDAILARSEERLRAAAERSGRENRNPLLIENLRRVLLEKE